MGIRTLRRHRCAKIYITRTRARGVYARILGWRARRGVSREPLTHIRRQLQFLISHYAYALEKKKQKEKYEKRRNLCLRNIPLARANTFSKRHVSYVAVNNKKTKMKINKWKR